MLRDLKLNVFYPYSPEQVWQVITNRRALAAWLMDNDFEPRVGHKFRFQSPLEQGVEGTIFCEVIELDEPRSLSYTWRGSFTSKPTIVTWTLVPVEGGTQLQLEHTGFESKAIQHNQPIRLPQTCQDNFMPQAILETRLPEPVNPGVLSHLEYPRVDNVDRGTLNFYLRGGWHVALESKIQNVLTHKAEQECLASEPSLLSQS